MKKIIMLAVLLCLFTCVKAQYIGSQYINAGIGLIVDKSQFNIQVGAGKVHKNLKFGGNLGYRHLNEEQVKANTITAGPELSYYLLHGSKFGLLGVVGANIGYQKAETKTDLVKLPKNSAFVYGYQIGIRPELLLSPSCALFVEYKFEMLFNSMLRDNNHLGVGLIFYL